MSVESLKDDHRTLKSRWQILRPALLKIAAGEPQALLADDVMPRVALYGHHIAREEAELLPTAARMLSDSALERVARAMRGRRGSP